MASRVSGRHSALPARDGRPMHWGRIALEIAILIGITSIFTLKIVAYVNPSALRLSTMQRAVAITVNNAGGVIRNLPFLHSCPHGLTMHDVPGGYVCITGPQSGMYDKIYTSYPLVGKDRESIYAGTDQGSIPAANDLLSDKFDVPRYQPVRLSPPLSWSEDPYSSDYWRLEFYSLRPSLNLLYAYRKTGQTAYARKVVSLDLSFVTAEGKSRWAWSDPHAVAFRAMALVDTWWKLRQDHQLSESSSTPMLEEIEKTGQFLADPNHYQQENNHSLNEAAALYELAAAFPTLPHSHQWLTLARQRFNWQLEGLIDGNGQLIENSPYYDFYALAKYWQIYQYSQNQGVTISPDFGPKLMSMLGFATYILEPNDQVPLLGASLAATINDHGVYSSMAAADPQFQYVLTHGVKGTQPTANSVYLPSSALTIMRSGWQKAPNYESSTYLSYNIGRYRTAHSDLDALAITLYGDGGELLPSAGLYTYSPGIYRNYFHGTASENTVVVDGKTQNQGNGTATKLVTADGLTYQSAESSLYDGVTHRRLVAMIDPSHVLVVDQLSSTTAHKYQQMFHLFPGAKLTRSGLTVVGTGGTPRRQVTIQQLSPSGIRESDAINQRGNHPAGLCSRQYGKLIPCYAISYSSYGRDASFYTLITIGRPQQVGFAVKVTANGRQVRIDGAQQHVTMALGQTEDVPVRAWASDPTPPSVNSDPVASVSKSGNWTATSGGVLYSARDVSDHDHIVTRLSTNTSLPVYLENDTVRLDLEQYNARLRIEINGESRLSEVRLILSNDHFAKTETMNMLDAYTRTFSGYWADIFVGPSGKWGPSGGWRASGPGFNWSKIDGIRFEIAGRVNGGKPSTVSVDSLSLIPKQKQAKLVFVFDDGYDSILSAANVLRQNGMPANVAAIGKYVDFPTQDHLNLYQLKQLQNDWGWDIVNHTQQHADAVVSYYDQNDLTGYAQDILQQATWLESNGLNSAPNWLILPHGSTNTELERVASRYYMFSRVVADNPDAYPYGNPQAVSDFEIQYPGDEGDGGSEGLTAPSQVMSVVRQAISNHTTLILTFHRIHSDPSDPAGYPLYLFKQIVSGIKDSGIKVMTLSQLDRSNGVPVNNRIYYKAEIPSQITVRLGN